MNLVPPYPAIGLPMIRIVISSDQAEHLRSDDETIELVDEKGRRIGLFNRFTAAPGWTAAEIEDAKSRAAGSRGGRTTAEVLDRLRSIDE